jgi:hypothetical protein
MGRPRKDVTEPFAPTPFRKLGHDFTEGLEKAYFYTPEGKGFIRGLAVTLRLLGLHFTLTWIASLTGMCAKTVAVAIDRRLSFESDDEEPEPSAKQLEIEKRRDFVEERGRAAHRDREPLSCETIAIEAVAEGFKCCAKTVALDLRARGFVHRKAVPCPIDSLSDSWAACRLKFCRETLKRIRSGGLNPKTIVFSDESIFRATPEALKHWVPDGEIAWGVERSKYVAHVHFWGAIVPNGKFYFHDVNTVECSGARGGLCGSDYAGLVNTALLTNQSFRSWAAKTGGWVFQQDGAPCHKGGTPALVAKGVTVLPDWPPYSPCLNPIENLWANVKRKVSKKMITKGTVMKNTKDNNVIFKKLVLEEFANLSQDTVRHLCDSFVTRLEACVAAEGRRIPY